MHSPKGAAHVFLQTQKDRSLAAHRRAIPFADLLSDWHSGAMAKQLALLGITKLDFHIDWLPEYRCIGIQGIHKSRYADIQIEPDAFFIAVDEVEPDDPREFPLESAQAFYQTVRSIL